MPRKCLLPLGVVCVAAIVSVGIGRAGASTPLPTTLARVAVYASTTYGTDVLNRLRATHRFASVDSLGNDCSEAPTPTLATLLHYRAVLVYSDCDFNDNVAIGNVLADFVDRGGRVVVATFAFWDPIEGLGMDGRLSTGGYLPLTQGGQTSGTQMTLVPDQPSSQLLAGVTTFDGGTSSYHNDSLALTSGAQLVAHWSGDGEPLVAYKGRVVALNFYPPSSDARADFWKSTTGGVRLMTNALLWGTFPS